MSLSVSPSKADKPHSRMSQETRANLVKTAAQVREHAKTRIRNLRRDAMLSLKDVEKEQGEDEAERQRKKVINISCF